MHRRLYLIPIVPIALGLAACGGDPEGPAALDDAGEVADVSGDAFAPDSSQADGSVRDATVHDAPKETSTDATSDTSSDGATSTDAGVDAPTKDAATADAQVDARPSDAAVVDAGGCIGVTYTGSITISSASDPDLATLANVECLVGSLYVDGTNLTSVVFPKLRQVTGTLSVSANPSASVVAFDSLTRVGYLHIANEATVASIGVGRLQEAGSVEISEVLKLTSLSFPALTKVAVHFRVTKNPTLAAVRAPLLESADNLLISDLGTSVDALETVDLAAFRSATDFTISSPSLRGLTLPSLETAEYLSLRVMPKLVALSLPKLRSVTGIMNIANNVALPSFDAPSLVSVDGYLLIGGCLALASLEGLRNLTSVRESITIGDSKRLVDLKGLSSLTSYKTLRLDSLEALTSLSGLAMPPKTAALEIVKCPSLGSLAALAGISEMAGLSLDQVGLTSMAGLDGLTAVAGGVRFWQLPELTDVRGLAQLKSVGSILFYNEPKLTSVDLPSLSIASSVYVSQTGATAVRFPSLTNVTKGTSSSGDLAIQSNAALTSLDFQRLRGVANGFTLSDNPRLSSCVVEALRKQVVAADGIGGTVRILGNLAVAPCP